MRESWFKPLGLVTQPNEMGVYPAGAMLRAENLVARNPGELEQREGPGSFATGLNAAGNWPVKMLHTGAQLVSINVPPATPTSPAVTWTNAAGSSSVASLPDNGHMTPTFTGWPDIALFRDRVIVCSEGDPVIADYIDPTTNAERTFRYMSMPQPVLSPSGVSSTNAQALGASRQSGYAAIFVRTYADGYTVISPPSLVLRFNNRSTIPTNIVDPQIAVFWFSHLGRMAAGDVIEFYRTQSVPLSSPANTNPDPGTTCYLVATHTITSAELPGGAYVFTDTAKDGPIGESFGGLGRAMYTNPGQSGLEGVNTPPPAAKRVAVYKGRAFYANYKTPGEATVALRGGSGNLANLAFGTPLAARKSGVGTRYVNMSIGVGATTATGISANDFIGLTTGQVIGINGGPHITALNPGAGTLSFATPFVGPAIVASLVNVSDVTEIGFGYTPNLLAQSVMDTPQRIAPYEATARTVSDLNQFAQYDQAVYLTNQLSPTTTLTIRGTNGQNYDPEIPQIFLVNDATDLVSSGQTPTVFQPKEYPNGLRFSKDQQPEAVPPSNEIFIGQGEIYGMYSTRDALWIFASDGLWRLSGTMARAGQVVDVRVDPVDSTLILAGPQAGCVLRDAVYAYTNRGLVRIDDLGIMELSEGMVSNLLPGAAWSTGPYVGLGADEDNDDIYITVRSANTTPLSNNDTTYVYSTAYNIFTSCQQITGLQRLTAFAYDRVTRTFFGIAGNNASTATIYKLTRTGVAYLTGIIDFQPSYAEDPLAGKQWLDATCVFNSEAANWGASPRWNGTTNATGSNFPFEDLVSKESRINFACPRSAAVGNAIYFGVIMTSSAGTAPVKLKAVSLRFEYLSDQQVFR